MSDPFNYTKRMRRAIVSFLLLITVVVLLPRIYLLYREPPVIKIDSKGRKAEEAFLKRHADADRKPQRVQVGRYFLPVRAFDPNTYQLADWQALGLSEKQAAVLIRRGKFGFRRVEDIQNMYVIDSSLFSLIRDSLIFFPEDLSRDSPDYQEESLAQSEDSWQRKISGQSQFSRAKIALNTANEQDLKGLYGIGDYFSKAIVSHRDLLGGFHSSEQLLEIWKMDRRRLNNILQWIEIDPAEIKKLNINTISARELQKHPYFTWNVANSIVKLRSQMGMFKSVDEVKQSDLVDEVLFDKIKHYLITNPDD